MKLTFLGANQEVTGSSTLLDIGGLRILIDCGIVQSNGGLKEFSATHEFNTREFEFDTSTLDYLFITHPHGDHCLRSPRLFKENSNVKIISTEATAKLMALNLQDSAYLNAQECDRWNKKVTSTKFIPMYTMSEALDIIPNIRCYDYNKEIKLNDKVSAILKPNGHIIGSCMIEFILREEFYDKRILFLGDTSGLSSRIPFTKPCENLGDLDYIVSESTYGNRVHEKINFKKELYKILSTTTGNVLLPAFAIHKSTVLLQFLYELFQEHPELNKFNVYLDSPMAIESNSIIANSKEYWGDKWSDDVFNWDKVTTVSDFQQSQAVSSMKNAIIISASGMLSGGRIVASHLPKILPQKDSCIVFTGFAPEGTLAHKLLTTEKKTISLNGKPIPIHASRHKVSFSGHADKNELTELIKTSNKKRLKKVFLIHGDDDAQEELKDELQRHLNDVDVIIPKYKEMIKL